LGSNLSQDCLCFAAVTLQRVRRFFILLKIAKFSNHLYFIIFFRRCAALVIFFCQIIFRKEKTPVSKEVEDILRHILSLLRSADTGMAIDYIEKILGEEDKDSLSNDSDKHDSDTPFDLKTLTEMIDCGAVLTCSKVLEKDRNGTVLVEYFLGKWIQDVIELELEQADILAKGYDSDFPDEKEEIIFDDVDPIGFLKDRIDSFREDSRKLNF
jgi:hypothetical protein